MIYDFTERYWQPCRLIDATGIECFGDVRWCDSVTGEVRQLRRRPDGYLILAEAGCGIEEETFTLPAPLTIIRNSRSKRPELYAGKGVAYERCTCMDLPEIADLYQVRGDCPVLHLHMRDRIGNPRKYYSELTLVYKDGSTRVVPPVRHKKPFDGMDYEPGSEL